MKRNYAVLLFILLLLGILSGNLTAGVSLLGHLGIRWFYQEYSFLKTWWQAALVFWAVMLLIGFLMFLLDRKLQGLVRKSMLLICFFMMLTGLYFTFQDFRNDLSHRLLGERFHLGIYLYWVGGAILSLFFALTPKDQNQKLPEDPESNAAPKEYQSERPDQTIN